MSPQSNPSLSLKEIKPLFFKESPQPQRPPVLTRASGLVKVQSFVFVISDDDNYVARFNLDPDSPGLTFPLSPPLPTDPKERWKLKPDLEAVTDIEIGPYRGLLAVPSGSTPNSRTGYWMELSESFTLDRVRPLDFVPFFESLDIDDLNIEATFQIAGHLALLHRARTERSRNAFILCNLETLMHNLESGRLTADCREMTYFVDLGSFRQSRLGFTDACYYREDKFLYVAVSESEGDREFKGAELGCMNIQGEILYRQTLDLPSKPEGICIQSYDDPQDFLIVTNSGSKQEPSRLYSGRLPDFE